jgi:hypothetical protein
MVRPLLQHFRSIYAAEIGRPAGPANISSKNDNVSNNLLK